MLDQQVGWEEVAHEVTQDQMCQLELEEQARQERSLGHDQPISESDARLVMEKAAPRAVVLWEIPTLRFQLVYVSYCASRGLPHQPDQVTGHCTAPAIDGVQRDKRS